MTRGFAELAIGGVLVAPFVTYATAALIVYLALRPVLHLIAFDRLFISPPVAELSLYVIILASLFVLV